MVAQPTSRLNCTRRPYFSNSPSSRAITRGAQSHSGTKPNRRGLPRSDFVSFVCATRNFLEHPLAARVPEPGLGANKTAHFFQARYEFYSYIPEPLGSLQLRTFASLASGDPFWLVVSSQSAFEPSINGLKGGIVCRLFYTMSKTPSR